ncbi:integrative conjugative element protein, RAQPRD family [Paracidovorax valerianellae]|uniref:Integrative conjugative element protein, RAQPRD family n=1 Tax=Paracidovorax valerianellae TaxID=187868 RepID=A0A1G6LII8_9BURK|nr:RAQPRD family integrative conjugative element protein [Paracidovorax valerianellae]SDC42416.1 integrative conjugative element protein, RAQPRD family [Paracidovorax valerianellae]
MTSRATASHDAPVHLPLCGVLAVALLCGGVASAHADPAIEREQLTSAIRLLDQLDRIALASDTTAAVQPARYHFDYARLRDDVGRMRAGFASYLTPQRAQPRDPSSLAGHYTREDARESTSPSPQQERSR